MRDVVWSETALDDIDAAIAYIAADNPATARKVLDRIEATGDQLGRMSIGRPGRVTGTYERSVVDLPYIIAYALPPSEDRVVILRVIHSARNWPKDEWPE